MEKYYINQKNWQSIYSILQGISGIRVKEESATHTFMEGVYFILKTGAQWRELPSLYGKWRSIHKRYESWCRKGVLSKVLDVFSIGYDEESVMIDATIVRAHPCAAGYKKGQNDREALGRSKGGFTTKIHAVVDALGQALKLSLTAGQRHDITQTPHLIEGFANSNVIADKAYDSKAFIEQIEKQHCTPVIPPRSNRKDPRYYDEHLYKERHLVECFFRACHQLG